MGRRIEKKKRDSGSILLTVPESSTCFAGTRFQSNEELKKCLIKVKEAGLIVRRSEMDMESDKRDFSGCNTSFGQLSCE